MLLGPDGGHTPAYPGEERALGQHPAGAWYVVRPCQASSSPHPLTSGRHTPDTGCRGRRHRKPPGMGQPPAHLAPMTGSRVSLEAE